MRSQLYIPLARDGHGDSVKGKASESEIDLDKNLQTGITVINHSFHHSTKGKLGREQRRGHTVDGNGNGFGQLVTICTNERGYFAQRINLEIVLGKFTWWLCINNFEIKPVSFGYHSNGSGTRIALCLALGVSSQSHVQANIVFLTS